MLTWVYLNGCGCMRPFQWKGGVAIVVISGSFQYFDQFTQVIDQALFLAFVDPEYTAEDDS